jgi:hypothetical protein
MDTGNSAARQPSSRWVGVGVLGLAALVAVLGGRGYAGGANDGSRLATVECLADHGTLAVDQSIFVKVPAEEKQTGPSPYAPTAGSLREGTCDKLLIHGHYYSDKSPVPALVMAGTYRALQWCTGLTARERADRFCYTMTVLFSGLAYVVAVWCIYALARTLGLPPWPGLALTASFALATVALPYTRHVNNHILLLAVTAALALSVARLAEDVSCGRSCRRRLLWLGTLAGLGYTIDLGVGPIVLACTLLQVTWRCQRLGAGVGVGLAALPWLTLHHAMNYAVGGTLKPVGAVPEYLHWSGTMFNAANMTGTWKHESGWAFLNYALPMMVGPRGFLNHCIPLFLAVPGIALLWKRPEGMRPELLFAVGCTLGTWLLYAAYSNNYAGICCSVRWFVPLLAPGYFVLALLLRRHPEILGDFLILRGWGLGLGVLIWGRGPWQEPHGPYAWALQGGALVHWGLYRGLRWRRSPSSFSLYAASGFDRRSTSRIAAAAREHAPGAATRSRSSARSAHTAS